MGLRRVIVPLVLAVVGGVMLSALVWHTFPCRGFYEANAKMRQALEHPQPSRPRPPARTSPESESTVLIENPYGIGCEDFGIPPSIWTGVGAILLFVLGIATAIFERRRPVLASIFVAAAAMTGALFVIDYLIIDVRASNSLPAPSFGGEALLIALFVLVPTVPAAVGAWIVATIRRRRPGY